VAAGAHSLTSQGASSAPCVSSRSVPRGGELAPRSCVGLSRHARTACAGRRRREGARVGKQQRVRAMQTTGSPGHDLRSACRRSRPERPHSWMSVMTRETSRPRSSKASSLEAAARTERLRPSARWRDLTHGRSVVYDEDGTEAATRLAPIAAVPRSAMHRRPLFPAGVRETVKPG
jgi:hypothetical protein